MNNGKRLKSRFSLSIFNLLKLQQEEAESEK
jgi:hypothetical protein